MSFFFRASHDETGPEVAVQVLSRALAKHPTLLQRFLRKAKHAALLACPSLVSLFDRGVDQGRHSLILEFVPGGHFHDDVREHSPLGIAASVTVIREVAGGFRFAASRRLIHHHLKPANLLRATA